MIKDESLNENKFYAQKHNIIMLHFTHLFPQFKTLSWV